VHFLLSRQGDDGLWRDFATPAGEASAWPTGFIATALALAGADGHALERAAERLLAGQRADGGWGYNEDVPSDADSTAWVLLFLARAGRAGQECERAAAFLAAHQDGANGGIATYRDASEIRRFMGVGRWMRFGGWCSPHTEVTATAGRALTAVSDIGRAGHADAAWRYVRSRQRDDGSWASYWWTSPYFATHQAVQFALSRGGRWRGDGTASDAAFGRACADRAADWMLHRQDDAGGWSAPDAPISPFATALCLSVLAQTDSDRRAVDRAVERLAALQQPDGGWCSHPILRIPRPGEGGPDSSPSWRPIRIAGGIVVADQHRTFTSAACVEALARTHGA
jgi:squalene cyclase